MFELYGGNNRIPKEKYDIIYKMIVDNYFDVHKDLVEKRKEIDTEEGYNHWVNTILNTQDYYILLYYLENSIIGFTAFMYDDDKLWLCEVQFDSKYKNRGYLRTMLSKVYEISDKSRYNSIFLTINNKNYLSQNVFKHIGFEYVSGTKYRISAEDFAKWLNHSLHK